MNEHIIRFFLRKEQDMVQISRLKNQRWSDVIGRGGVKSVLRHIADGADINAKDEEDGATPLIRALQYDSATIAEALIERGAKVNARDKDGETALMIAAGKGMAGLVDALIARGAKVNAKDKYGRAPLAHAVLRTPEIVNALIKAGAKVNAKDDMGHSALRDAAECGSFDVIRALLDAGADDLGPALWKAAWLGRSNVAKLLIERGADLKKWGGVSLMNAAIYGHLDIVGSLIDAGTDVNAKAENGKTALMFAAIGAQAEAVKLLLDAGADVRAADNDGLTALTFAKEGKNPETVRLLENALSL